MKKLVSLWANLPDSVKRVVHTFYQAFLGVFFLGLTGILTDLLNTGDINQAKAALLALVAAAVAAAISAVKASLVKRWS